jgi:diguanylate cyclase (GGDEF)-like protein
MPETDHKGARKVAERLRSVLAELQLKHGALGVGPFVTLSIGIATQVPSEDFCPDWLLTQADQALYAAKHSGRNRVVSAGQTLAAFVVAAEERNQETAITSKVRPRLRRR